MLGFTNPPDDDEDVEDEDVLDGMYDDEDALREMLAGLSTRCWPGLNLTRPLGG